MATNTVTTERGQPRLSALTPLLKVTEAQHALLKDSATDCCAILEELTKRFEADDDRVAYSLMLRAEMLSNLILAVVGGGDEGCIEHYGIAAYGHTFKVNGVAHG